MTALFSLLLGSAIDHPEAVCVMILMRFAISIFALSLLGLALSLSAAQSQQNGTFVDNARITAH